MRTYLLRFIAITLCLILATVANAATYTVNSTADPGDGICDATAPCAMQFSMRMEILDRTRLSLQSRVGRLTAS